MRQIMVFAFVICWGLILSPLAGSGGEPAGNGGPELLPVVSKNIPEHLPGKGLIKEKVDKRFGNVPLYFVPNRGQVAEDARFYARTSRYTLWLTAEGMVFDTAAKHKNAAKGVSNAASNGNTVKRDVSRLVFLHANRGAEMVAGKATKHKVNIIKGKKKENWKTGIPTFEAVEYKEIYHAIDLRVYGVEKQIEYDWIVNPGGDPGEICFYYKQVKGTRLDDQGNLVVETQLGELVHKRPVAYQEIGGARVKVAADFKKINTNIFGIEVGPYDKKQRLVIDPVVVAYSTFLGGNLEDNCYGLAVDGSGCAYLTGNTKNTDFPTANAYQSAHAGGNSDMYVTKFTASGAGLEYSTYIGGTNDEAGEGIVIDGSGRAHVTGHTQSTDFPIKNAYQSTIGGNSDAVLIILGSSGGTLEYSTFLGGTNMEKAFAIDLDASGNIYIAGVTRSYDYPTKSAYDTYYGGGDGDAFVAKFNSSGSSLAYSTYLGGYAEDAAYGIAVHGSNAYVTGRTASSTFPRQNEYQNAYGGGSFDVFVTKLSTAGTSLVYSTFLGGDGTDSAWGIDVDSGGKAYIVGNTNSSNFPTANGYQTSMAGVKDAFITCFDSSGTSLYYSTYFGGSESDAAAHVIVNGSGSAYIVGSTYSSDFPVKRSSSSYSGSADAFVTMFDTAGGSINFSTFLGGSSDDSGRGIVLDSSGNIIIAGTTESWDFPDSNAYQSAYGGNEDAFLAKYSTYELGSLCGAVDNCDLTWTTGGNADWFEQTTTAYYDDDALQSGAVTDGQSTYVQTTVQGPGVLTFRWRVSSSYSDTLSFYIDGVSQDSISGSYNTSWYQGSYNIPGGTHTLKWEYAKNASYSYGSDCGWLDRVTFSQSADLVLSRDQMTFGAAAGAATGSQAFSVDSNSGGNFDWTVTTDQSWLSCSPSSGSGSGVVTVNCDNSGLGAGTYTGTISVTCATASNSPHTIPVTLNVYGTGQSAAPFGSYDTPTHGTTVSGSVPFTGWVLDDVEVQEVMLFVDYGKLDYYIDSATFVEGARPDVEQAYPDYPNNYKAGWGYMMLTNYLPAGGNGTYNIKAVALDVEGNYTNLGTKTIIVDNVNAVKPFGAIDTPEQGGPASGNEFMNWGWVLTPQPNAIPTDGSTISVLVNGVKVGNPVYNLYRKDIATLFPDNANSNGAVGYFKLDTTQYENGVYTIQWTATDDAGNTDGIGSRFFMIQNSNRQSGKNARTRHTIKDLPPTPVLKDIIDRAERPDPEPVTVKRGFGSKRKYGKYDAPSGHLMTPGQNGAVPIEIKEMERVKVNLRHSPGNNDNKGFYSGWSVVGEKLKPLPIGSTLDSEKGIFYWSPGPGFAGEYRFVFARPGKDGSLSYKLVTIMIKSKF